MSWALILFLLTVSLYIIPLLPGIVEMIRPTDIQPLRVAQEYDSNPMHFAEGFRNYVSRNFADLTAEQNRSGVLDNKTKYQIVGDKGVPHMDDIKDRLLLSAHALTLPAGEIFESEVYSRQGVITGERSQFRALMADNTLNIREHSTIMRWAHSDGDMVVGRYSKLHGRATSKQSIILNEGVQFERLHAPIILSTSRNVKPSEASLPARTTLTDLPDIKMQSGRRWVLNGHLEFPANHFFDGDIVTGTTANIGDNVHIKGSLKCNAADDIAYHLQNTGVTPRSNKKIARCEIGNNVFVDGSLVSSHDLFIGQNCKILGPVIAEGLLVIGAGTVIGSPEHPTSVTAPRIIIESGCTVYGTLWASENGMVSTANQSGVAA